MNVELTTDRELVRAILMEPDIWDRAAEDGINQDAWYPKYDSMTAWLLCIEEGDIVYVPPTILAAISMKVEEIVRPIGRAFSTVNIVQGPPTSQ